ncbi:hypothetical protein ASC80_06295 [Afipia sp. Root123D2]|nr:hypothetical protein ASC80_06295 [Afipia sp. Root123D2]
MTESYLLNPAYKAEIQIDRFDPAAPTAPPLADGLAATAAGGAAEEEGAALADAEPTFDLLWRTYGKERAGGKKEARAAWNALPPETDLAAVIEAAAAWQQSWAAQGKPDAPRFTLARWLKDERYDEDAPTGYQPKERPAKSGNQKSDNPAKPRKAKATHAFAEGETRLEIIKADVVEGETSSRLVLTLSDASGEEFTHSITTEHHKPDVQQAGQDELQSFVVGAGFYFQPPLPPELIGRVVVALVDENGLSWHGPRNGQPRPEPQPEANGSPPPPPADWPAWLDAERDAA